VRLFRRHRLGFMFSSPSCARAFSVVHCVLLHSHSHSHLDMCTCARVFASVTYLCLSYTGGGAPQDA
jgi:hypothetical protein